ncbi:hypothetical protein HanPI659440_Chr06g0244551 [Helianthus annuus]|nr:hypothetical protein HanPI659440_Chr06g0244551 [Helianthus annuus]
MCIYALAHIRYLYSRVYLICPPRRHLWCTMYTSLMRSTKIGALISHGSITYYACIGESTDTYQSP